MYLRTILFRQSDYKQLIWMMGSCLFQIKSDKRQKNPIHINQSFESKLKCFLAFNRWLFFFITFWPGYECARNYFSQLLTFAPQHRTYLNHVTGVWPQFSRHSEGTPPEVPAVVLIGPPRRQTRASFCNESRDLPRRIKWMNNSIFRL